MPPWYQQMLQQLGGTPMLNRPVPFMPGSTTGMFNEAMGAVGGASTAPRMAGANSILPPLPGFNPLGGSQNLGQFSGAMMGDASTATRLAGANSIMPRTVPGLPTAGAAEELASAAPAVASGGRLAALRGAFPLKGAGGLGLAGMGVQMAGPMLWNDPESAADNKVIGGVGGALTGAGIGAGIGSFLPGPGTLIGGAAGGLIGGALGYFGGEKQAAGEGTGAVKKAQDAARTQLTSILSQIDTDRDPKSAQRYRNLALKQLNTGFVVSQPKTPDQVDQLTQQILQAAVQGLPGDIQQEETDTQNAADYKTQQQQLADAQRVQAMQQDRDQRQAQANIAAYTAWLGPMMEKQNAQSQQYADQFRDASMSAANQMSDPAMRAASQAVAQQISAGQASQNQYTTMQVAQMPGYLQQAWAQHDAEQQQLKQLLDMQMQQLQLKGQGLDVRNQQLNMIDQQLQFQQQMMNQYGTQQPATSFQDSLTQNGGMANASINPSTGALMQYGAS